MLYLETDEQQVNKQYNKDVRRNLLFVKSDR